MGGCALNNIENTRREQTYEGKEMRSSLWDLPAETKELRDRQESTECMFSPVSEVQRNTYLSSLGIHCPELPSIL